MSNINLSGIGMTSQRTRSRLVQRLMHEGIKDQDVLNLVENTPRHLFVDEALSHRAYEDTALPIGMGQTISQPYIVARMTEALIAEGRPRKVLEIGTGCGYQAAILAQLCDQVYTLERIGSLQTQAKSRLASLGLRNVQYRHGDGLKGWESAAPFDGIVVTAAPAQVPHALLNQLAEGGRMIIPVGHSGGAQELFLIERQNDEFISTELCKVRFVPLLGGTLA